MADSDVKSFQPSNLSKILIIVSTVFISIIIDMIFENFGFQAAGRVASTLVIVTSYLIYAYFDYLSQSWFRFFVLSFIILNAAITIFSAEYEATIDGRATIPIGLLYYFLTALIVDAIARHMDGRQSR